jgi:general secretion pathway protein I
VKTRGFTLLEVLIALAIVAVALVGLVRVAGFGADALARERDITLATWVAANVLTEARVAAGFPPVGKRDGTARMGTRDWRWELVVQPTTEAAIRRLDVRVFDPAVPGGSPVASLSGFAGDR